MYIADMHCDTIMKLWLDRREGKLNSCLRSNEENQDRSQYADNRYHKPIGFFLFLSFGLGHKDTSQNKSIYYIV